MEGSGLSGRIFSNVGGGILGLEMPLHPPSSSQSTNQNPTQNHLQKHPQIIPFNQPPLDQQTQLTMKQPNYPYPNPSPNPNPNPSPSPNPPLKNKTQMGQSPNSDEDEPGNDDGSYDGKRKSPSPWQRMKWTDNMVRLLIMAVYYIGDEAGNDHGLDKKKASGAIGSSGAGVLQKKGKWKSVSRAMMEKGFYVSPQQCEDKFNDLNKRYKRVNDILGKGTACKVVENQSLLDSMDISPKLKDEARKLLNSKHLFFREMCAYHRSCGHDTTGHGNSLEVSQQQQINNPQQQQSCHHTTTSTPPIVASSSMVPHHDDDDENHDDDDDDEYDDEDEDEDEEHEENGPRKRARTNGGILSNTFQAWQQQLNNEITGILQDGSKSSWEKKNWVLTQLIQLEEKGLGFQYQAMEIEKQRQKWIKFSNKKEREMEKMKLDNIKNRLENEKMVLFLKKKEMELLAIEQQQQPSCVSG